MKQQIKSIGVFHAAKVVGALQAVIGLIYTVIGIAIVIFSEGESRNAGIFLVFMPVIMGIFAFIFTTLTCWIYNQIVRRMGGIEVILEDVSQ